MWRWPVVQAKKNLINAMKWKIFWLHAKLISIAASKWTDPNKNPDLENAIYKAKKASVPIENIERAIKKLSHENKDESNIQEIFYEGYAPWWVSVIVGVLTDNKNRTVSNIRHIFNKYSWSMGEAGSVSWMFHRKGIIFIDINKYSYDIVEEIIFDTDAEDISKTDSYIKIITNVNDLYKIEKTLESKWVDILESKLDFLADTEIEIIDFERALKFKKMMEAFDEDEDVNIVSTNEIISSELEKEVELFIEKNTFRT